MPFGVPVRAISTPIDETSRYGRTPARSAASASRTAAAWSTVCLRSALLPGPAPAAKATASAPRPTSATSSTDACSRSSTAGCTPSASRSARWSGLRTMPTTVSPRADRRRPSRRGGGGGGAGAAGGKETPEPAGDLAVGSGDDDAHAAVLLRSPGSAKPFGRLTGPGQLGGGVAVGPGRRQARVDGRPVAPRRQAGGL